MGTLTGLSGEYVTFDQNADSVISNNEQLTFRTDSFERLVTLLGRLVKR